MLIASHARVSPALRSRLEKVDKVYPLALLALCKRTGIRHFQSVSVRGADAKDGGDGWHHYKRIKGESDDAVLQSEMPLGIVILRPGPLDRGEELRSVRQAEMDKHAKGTPMLAVASLARSMIAAWEQRLDSASDASSAANQVIEETALNNEAAA